MLMIEVSSPSLQVCIQLMTWLLLLGVSEEEVQEQLGKDEAAVQSATGRLPLHKTSAVDFLSMGLELEESQYVAVYWTEQ